MPRVGLAPPTEYHHRCRRQMIRRARRWAMPTLRPRKQRVKPKLDDIRRREICAILAVGGTRTLAASYVGCHVETIRNTASRDPDFALQLRKAEISPEIAYLRSLQTAAQDSKQWRAAAWALERLFPDRYGPRKAQAITISQMTEILNALGTIVADEVPVKKYRQRVLERLAELIADLPKPKAKSRPRRAS